MADENDNGEYILELTPNGWSRNTRPPISGQQFEKDMRESNPGIAQTLTSQDHSQDARIEAMKDEVRAYDARQAAAEKDAADTRAAEAKRAADDRFTADMATARQELTPGQQQSAFVQQTLNARIAMAKGDHRQQQEREQQFLRDATQADIEGVQFRNEIVANLREMPPGSKIEFPNQETGELAGHFELRDGKKGQELVLASTSSANQAIYNADKPYVFEIERPDGTKFLPVEKPVEKPVEQQVQEQKPDAVQQPQAQQTQAQQPQVPPQAANDDSFDRYIDAAVQKHDERKNEHVNFIDRLAEKPEGISNSNGHFRLDKETNEVVKTKDGKESRMNADEARANEERRIADLQAKEAAKTTAVAK
jgi:hypothetical protein